MAKVKSKFVPSSRSAPEQIAPARAGNKGKPAALTIDDFTGEYRDVVKEAVAMKRNNALLSGKPVNPALVTVVEQAVMRVVHVGQKQRIAPSKVKEMVAVSSDTARRNPDWQPEKSLERRAGMLAGSTRLRKLG